MKYYLIKISDYIGVVTMIYFVFFSVILFQHAIREMFFIEQQQSHQGDIVNIQFMI